MFCKWCGNKITNNGVPCPTCGKEQDKLVNGNGFWDLCKADSNGGEQNAMSLEAVNIQNSSGESCAQTKLDECQNVSKIMKTSVKLIAALMFAMCIMIAIGLIESSIALNKAVKGLDEIAYVKEQLSDLRIDMSKGVTEIEKHIDTLTTTDTQNSDEVEINTDNNDLDDIFDLKNVVSIVKGVIFLESHVIESSKAFIMLIVSGDLAGIENARFVWQQFNEQTGEWDTFEKNQDYVLIKDTDEMKRIRVLCFELNEHGEYTVYDADYTVDDEYVDLDDYS